MTISKVSDISKPKCQKTWNIWKKQLGKKTFNLQKSILLFFTSQWLEGMVNLSTFDVSTSILNFYLHFYKLILLTPRLFCHIIQTELFVFVFVFIYFITSWAFGKTQATLMKMLIFMLKQKTLEKLNPF